MADAFIRLLGRLPLPVLYLVADALFLLLFHVLRYRRTLVRENLTAAFPEQPDRRIRELAAGNYRNVLDVLFETVRAQTLDRDFIGDHVRLENPELLSELAREHRTIIVAGAHQGNWEWLQLACSARLPLPLAALYKPLNHEALDSLLLELRGRFGSTLVPAASALPELVKFSRRPGIIALNADLGPRPEEKKYWGRFLGRDTAFFPGLEKLARVLNAPVVFVHAERTARGRYRARFETITDAPRSLNEGEIMQGYIRCLEDEVRAAPQDWLWLYKRWKYRRSVYEAS